jgi:ATP-dependent RNA helicase SUPV3L1/SUV3
MPPVLPAEGKRQLAGYRRIGQQWLRIDIAETLLREAHEARSGGPRKPFRISAQRAISSGLTEASHARLLRLAGFRTVEPRPLAKGAAGPPAPTRWRWRPTRRQAQQAKPVRKPRNAAFAPLAELSL